jgi:hypothetical protein
MSYAACPATASSVVTSTCSDKMAAAAAEVEMAYVNCYVLLACTNARATQPVQPRLRRAVVTSAYSDVRPAAAAAAEVEMAYVNCYLLLACMNA